MRFGFWVGVRVRVRLRVRVRVGMCIRRWCVHTKGDMDIRGVAVRDTVGVRVEVEV